MTAISFKRHRFPPDIIQHAVLLYLRFCLSYCDVEDILARRGIDVTYETVRRWILKFGPVFARRLRRRRPVPTGRWHLDEMFVSIRGKRFYLWRAVDHEGEVLEVYASNQRDRKAALRFLERVMKCYGRPNSIVTDRLRSYGSAMRIAGIIGRQVCGRWLNNRAENSHQPFRRREGAMPRFRDIKTLQMFAALHASLYNLFNLNRHLNRRDTFKQNRSAALAEWRQLVACVWTPGAQRGPM